MRVLTVLCAVLVLTSVTAAQAPTIEPVGNLAQLMRGVLFPNSNILFDTQMNDPGAPPTTESGTDSVSATFANIYTGWQRVEAAAVALAQIEPAIMLSGRLCQNGRPVPLDRDDFAQYARELTVAATKTFEAAERQDRQAVSDLTNEVAGACENCHAVYRRYPEENRCVSE